MRFLSKKSYLSIALLASMSLVGCGGGGSGSNNNPVASTAVSNASVAAQEVVTPIVQNSAAIIAGVPTASSRMSLEAANLLESSEINKALYKALDLNSFIRMATVANLGNVTEGIGARRSSCHLEIISYDKDKRIYERKTFPNQYLHFDPSEIDTNSPEYKEFIEKEYLSYCKIDNCDGVLENGVLKELTVNPGSNFFFEDKGDGYGVHDIYSCEGKYNSKIIAKYERSEDKNPKYYSDEDGIINSLSDAKGYYVYKVNSLVSEKTTYSLSNGIDISINKANVKTFDSYYGMPKSSYNGNINIKITGVKGSVIYNKKYFEASTSYYRYYGDSEPKWHENNTSFKYDIVASNEVEDKDVEFVVPVKVSIDGKLSDNENQNANINNFVVQINKITKGNKVAESVINDAEAHFNVEAKYNKPVALGNELVKFNKAKVDVTGIIFDFTKANDVNYKKVALANAKAHVEATETEKEIDIIADYDVKTKTATVKMNNNSNYSVKDDTLSFNFKTVDIDATNVDVLADNNCEGALLNVKGVEKDGVISERTYKVIGGKLVLQKKNDKISVVIGDLPTTGSDIEALASASAKTPVTPADKTATMKVGKSGDKTVANYKKASSNGKKSVEINASAKNNVIVAVGFYGEEFTIVIAFDKKNNIINGRVFKGKDNKKKIEDKDYVASFASQNGKNVDFYNIDGSFISFEIK